MVIMAGGFHPMLNKAKVYVMIFTGVLIVYMIFIIYRYNISKTQSEEHFTAQDDGYQARMYVMKVFDLVLNRKPTTEEITKFSAYKNEQDILLNVLKTYSIKSTNTLSEVDSETIEEETLYVSAEEKRVKRPISVPVQEEEQVQEDTINVDDYSLKMKPIPVNSPPTSSQVLDVVQSAYIEASSMYNNKETYANASDTVCISRRILTDLLDDLNGKITMVRNLM